MKLMWNWFWILKLILQDLSKSWILKIPVFWKSLFSRDPGFHKSSSPCSWSPWPFYLAPGVQAAHLWLPWLSQDSWMCDYTRGQWAPWYLGFWRYTSYLQIGSLLSLYSAPVPSSLFSLNPGALYWGRCRGDLENSRIICAPWVPWKHELTLVNMSSWGLRVWRGSLMITFSGLTNFHALKVREKLIIINLQIIYIMD